MRSANLLSILVLAPLACGQSATRDPRALRLSGDTLVARFELLRDLSASPAGADDLERPLHVRVWSDRVVIADRGSDRVAIVDSSGVVERWIGTRGHGPGEIHGIAHLAVQGDRLLVAEALNGRVSAFDFGGQYVESYIAPFAAGSLVATPEQIVIASKSPRHYATVARRAAEPALAFGRRRSDRDNRWGALPGHDLLAVQSGRFWVFDQGTGAMCRFERTASRGRCQSLPQVLLQRLLTYRDERVAAFERGRSFRVEAAPLAKDLVPLGRSLALLVPLPEQPAFLINIADATVTPVMHASDSLPSWVRRATSFAWDRSSFVIVSDEGIGRMYLAPRRTSDH